MNADYALKLRLLGITPLDSSSAPMETRSAVVSSASWSLVLYQPLVRRELPLWKDRIDLADFIRSLPSPAVERIPCVKVALMLARHVLTQRKPKETQPSEPVDNILPSIVNIFMQEKHVGNPAVTTPVKKIGEGDKRETRRFTPNLRFLRTMITNDKWANSSRPAACPLPAPSTSTRTIPTLNSVRYPDNPNRRRRRTNTGASYESTGKRTKTIQDDNQRTRANWNMKENQVVAIQNNAKQQSRCDSHIRRKGRGTRKAPTSPPIYESRR